MSRKLPPLNALRAFESAARHESFARASDDLNIAQSGISHHIRKLEDWLGTQLFERKGRGVDLTKNGEHLARILEDAFGSIEYEVRRIRSPRRTGTLTVQTYTTFAVLWLIPRLADFQVRFPGVGVLVNTSSSDVDFSREEVDIAIGYGELGEVSGHPEIHHDRLFRSTVFPVCHLSVAEKHHLSDPGDLARVPRLEVHSAADDWDRWLEKAGVSELSAGSVVRFDSYLVAFEAALAGQGVAIARTPFVDRYLENGGLVAPFDTQVEAGGVWYVACRHELSEGREIRAFREWLAELASLERNT